MDARSTPKYFRRTENNVRVPSEMTPVEAGTFMRLEEIRMRQATLARAMKELMEKCTHDLQYDQDNDGRLTQRFCGICGAFLVLG